MKKLLSAILVSVIVISLNFTAFADGVDGPVQKPALTVGVSADFPPFEYCDENKIFYGFDIDLMNYIGERIGYEIKFKELEFDGVIPAVINGEIDCAISAISITEERKNVIDFTNPYLSAEVTYFDNGQSRTGVEEYAIVFPDNSVEKAKLLEAAGYPAVYNMVNDALYELIADKTVEKLAEKHNLDKAVDGDGFDYEYTVALPQMDTDAEKISGTSFEIPSEWALSDVKKAAALNVTDEKNYRYRKSITREEFCELIYNYCTNVAGEPMVYDGENKFTDTDNTHILALNKMGIINGKSETKFAPDDLLTREEAAVILNRMVNKTIPVAVTEMYFAFNDEEEISEWAAEDIQTMCNMGIMKGVGENNFSPKSAYTTEQAIVTIMRVYEAQSADIGIIGGADGPTSIIVSGDVNEDEAYEKFCTDAKKNTVKLNDFYVDEAIKLVSESGKLAADKEFISLFTTNDEVTNKLLSLGKVDFNKPVEIYFLSSDREQMKVNIKALAGEYAESIDFEKLEKIGKKYNFSSLASLINSSYGAENLAAIAILINNRGYIMPKDFKDDFALFVQYEGEYSAIVSFTEYGDGVISANMSFVKNGDRDNVFRRVYEITQALGEGCVKILLVK